MRRCTNTGLMRLTSLEIKLHLAIAAAVISPEGGGFLEAKGGIFDPKDVAPPKSWFTKTKSAWLPPLPPPCAGNESKSPKPNKSWSPAGCTNAAGVSPAGCRGSGSMGMPAGTDKTSAAKAAEKNGVSGPDLPASKPPPPPTSTHAPARRCPAVI